MLSNQHSVLFGILVITLKTRIFLKTNFIPFFQSHLDDLRSEHETQINGFGYLNDSK